MFEMNRKKYVQIEIPCLGLNMGPEKVKYSGIYDQQYQLDLSKHRGLNFNKNGVFFAANMGIF